MLLERLILTNFRCFGPDPQSITFHSDVTAFVGTNGSGKTAVMQALLRMFGISNEHRTIRRQDFHVPLKEDTPPSERVLSLEAVFAFPELETDEETNAAGVPEFFHQMTNDEEGRLKCRLRLEATWTDDGAPEGAIEQKFFAVRTMNSDFSETDCSDIKALDRSHIQMIYVPARRDGVSQMSAFLRSRLWRAITWSERLRETLKDAGDQLNQVFIEEPGVDVIVSAVKDHWQNLHTAGTDAEPVLRPVDNRLHEFIRKTEMAFRPDESGGDRDLEELSDGQRSLFHLAMTAATLDVENTIASGKADKAFQDHNVKLPALTLFAVEEPENNLAPFYLARIIHQIEKMTQNPRAQAILSSHSASILFRVDPTKVRHFRLDTSNRTALVREIRLPDDSEDAAKYVREAVRAYPELYFARFVILGEGSSEEIVLPRLAEAMDLPIDRSFIAIVPLGGRHVNHLWRLLTDLEIPYATLLDLDVGREGGGWGRIKTACKQLLKNGADPAELFGRELLADAIEAVLDEFDTLPLEEEGKFKVWLTRLQQFNVFFCTPLDLDMSMLRSYRAAYQTCEDGMRGPSERGDPKRAVLGENGNPSIYGKHQDEVFHWYRYLFLGRGKPSTHVRVLAYLSNKDLADHAPDELANLLNHVTKVAMNQTPVEEAC